MTYEDLIVLIPCHSLEDFPTDLPEAQAASLLNSFAVLWHPSLLAAARTLPRWHRADDPPEVVANRLIMLPIKSSDNVPSGWVERTRGEGAVVINDLSEREPMLAAALGPLEVATPVDSELAADFLALGFCTLQVELLTRHMRHFSNIDEPHVQREVLKAADAAIAGDASVAREHLRTCFEVLTEARERFYPVDCYLIDLCLLIPRLADDHLSKSLAQLKPMNILVSGQDLEEISTLRPALMRELREAWERGSAALVGGEFREAPTPLLPLESILWEFETGRSLIRRLLERKPQVWGRRRYGLMPQLPQILQRFGYQAAMHVAMDDGLYPDMEYSKVRWEGTNGTAIDAISRIPLAAEGANSFLRFPQRMAESMDHDQVATVLFARWPEVKSPWMDDLRRMHGYSPVLGRFVTLEDYFEHTDSPGRMSGADINEYLSPFLVQSVAYQEADPIGRYVDHYRKRSAFDSAAWCRAIRAALLGAAPLDSQTADLERSLEGTEFGADQEKTRLVDAHLVEWSGESARQLADVVMSGGSSQPGYLLLNPLSFGRRVSVELSDLKSPPAAEGPVRFVQWDETRKIVTLDIPGSGFVWLPLDSSSRTAEPTKPPAIPMAEPNVLRNELFELHINEQTGGIGKLKGYGRSPNRLSHQLAFRFPRERRISGNGEDFGEKTYYSQMRMLESRVTCFGPAIGELVTIGEIVDQTNDKRLAGYRQTFRVARGRPLVDIQIELDIDQMPDGDPWSNYFAARFAWNDSAASITRSVLMGAQGIKEERFESPHYLELATESQRTTLANLGLPFHRKTGDRMVDTLLVVAGETRRSFRFVIAVDHDYPMQAALDALTPVIAVPTKQGPPRSGRAGWFFHLDVRNVQLTRIVDRMNEPPEHADHWNLGEDLHPPPGSGCAVRLVETEGRPVRVKLRAFRTPSSARQRDFEGRTLAQLQIEDDAVVVDLNAFEIADVELNFEVHGATI